MPNKAHCRKSLGAGLFLRTNSSNLKDLVADEFHENPVASIVKQKVEFFNNQTIAKT